MAAMADGNTGPVRRETESLELGIIKAFSVLGLATKLEGPGHE